MNFFQAQAAAKRQTIYLIVLFSAAVVGLIVLAFLFILFAMAYVDTLSIEKALQNLFQYATFDVLMMTAVAVLGVVFFGIVSMYLRLSSGGEAVAVALGGKKLHPQSNSLQHQQLYHVVEEMAIASGIAVPPIYVLDDHTINAFAAGFTSDDAAIGVTQGLLDKLNRDELQGVIAHEFSHIFNGDMRLNMRLASLVNGILALGNVGQALMRASFRSSGTSRRDKNGSSAFLIGAVVGVGLFIIGYVGVIAGTMIKARISRAREYLADATAVQYTRLPSGIANALKKIKLYQSQLHAPTAATFSHLYFASGFTGWMAMLFATHPPLDRRIKAIEPTWDGTLPLWDKSAAIQVEANTRQPMSEEHFTQAVTLLDRVGVVEDAQLDFARQFMRTLDPKLRDQLHNPLGAQAVVLSLLSDDRMIMRNRQWALVEGVLKKELAYTHILLKTLDRKAAIHLVHLALPALKESTLTQYKTLKLLVTHFIEMDTKLTLFEWSIEHIVLRPLDMHFGLAHAPVGIYSTIGAIKHETELLISLLAQLQSHDETTAEKYFDSAKNAIGATALAYVPRNHIHIKNFNHAVNAIEKAKMPVKERIFKGCLFIIDCDAKRTTAEIELIHALATLLHLPLGPFVGGEVKE